jgi:BirA family biotin operon repressor/biotin-[acetyl-CoA-carboxylase] ligase
MLPPSYTFLHKKVCESTMEEGLQWLSTHKKDTEKSFIIVADTQTKGRGRRGRPWQSLEGNLFMSLAFWLPSNVTNFSKLSFVSVVALGETLKILCPEMEIGYKWPNDLLIQNKKVAGILIETDLQGKNRGIVMGIGVNLKVSPLLKNYPTTSIYDEGHVIVSPEVFLATFVPLFDRYKDLWLKEGFLKISQEWHKRALYLEQPISILTTEGSLTGIFQGMDGRGHLKLQVLPGDVRTFSTADTIKPDKQQD